MGSHGQYLLQKESSAEITSLLTLHRLSQRVAEVHSTFETNEHPPMDPEMEALNAEVNIQMFQHEIQEWRKSVPMSIRNLRTLITNFTCSHFNFGLLHPNGRVHSL